MQVLRQSTATQAVLIGPFVDDTDGVTAETGLSIANTDIRISKNGGNLAAKNSGGGTHDENGWYAVTLDATDTDTVGRLQLHCAVSGALPVFAEFQVVEEAAYDAIFASGADPATGADIDGLNDLDAAGIRTAIGMASADLDTQLDAIVADTNELQTDDVPGLIAALNDPTAATIADAVLDEALSGHVTAGTLGKAVADIETDATAILADTNELQTDDVPGLIAALENLSAAGVRTAVGLASANLDTQLSAIVTDTNELQADWANGGRLDLLLDAVKAKTDNLPSGIAKNVALSNFPFTMVDATDFATPETGLTVTATISKDGAAFAAATNSVAEVANGVYTIDLTQAEMNADTIVLKFTASGAAQRVVVLKTDA